MTLDIIIIPCWWQWILLLYWWQWMQEHMWTVEESSLLGLQVWCFSHCEIELCPNFNFFTVPMTLWIKGQLVHYWLRRKVEDEKKQTLSLNSAPTTAVALLTTSASWQQQHWVLLTTMAINSALHSSPQKNIWLLQSALRTILYAVAVKPRKCIHTQPCVTHDQYHHALGKSSHPSPHPQKYFYIHLYS